MLINTSFNTSDRQYFREHFKIKGGNVESLDDAEVILIGEKHDCLIHTIKECWLINKILRDSDTIYMETGKKSLNPHVYPLCMGYHLKYPVSAKGWDSRKARSHLVARTQEFDESLKKYQGALQLLKKNPSREILLAFLKNDIEKLDEQGIEALFHTAKAHQLEHGLDFDYLPKKLLREIEEEMNETSPVELKALFLTYLMVTTLLSNSVFHAAFRIIDLWRELKLFKNAAEHAGGRFIGIAGKAHLTCKNIEGLTSTNGLLDAYLKDKKFLILAPTKSKGGIGYALKYLHPYKIGPIHSLFLKSLERLQEWDWHMLETKSLILGACLGIVAMNINFTFAMSSFLGGILLSEYAKQKHQQAQAKENNYTDVQKSIERFHSLKSDLEHKISKLPPVLQTKLSDTFQHL